MAINNEFTVPANEKILKDLKKRCPGIKVNSYDVDQVIFLMQSFKNQTLSMQEKYQKAVKLVAYEIRSSEEEVGLEPVFSYDGTKYEYNEVPSHIIDTWYQNERDGAYWTT